MIQLPIALQAYSLRKIFEDNPLQAMNIIKNAGYDGVEFYGTHYQTELYVALLRQTGLVCAGWHTGIEALESKRPRHAVAPPIKPRLVRQGG